jgi:hypothetical protein
MLKTPNLVFKFQTDSVISICLAQKQELRLRLS